MAALSYGGPSPLTLTLSLTWRMSLALIEFETAVYRFASLRYFYRALVVRKLTNSRALP